MVADFNKLPSWLASRLRPNDRHYKNMIFPKKWWLSFSAKLSEWYVVSRQYIYMTLASAGKNRRAIVFIAPGEDIVNGGVMSIIAIAKETDRLKWLHKADVFVCTFIANAPILKYTKFSNDRLLLDFATLLWRFDKGSEVLVHVPEMFVPSLLHFGKALLASMGHKWHFNILLQNIDYCPQKADIDTLSELGIVTVTSAHKAYAGIETQKMLGKAIHHLSAWTTPDTFKPVPFAKRKNIIVVSPDPHERREEILAHLMSRLPGFRFVTVKDMTYYQYRELIASAKFSLTFGEGLDGYFSEIVFTGGIGCAVYNDRFFTNEFAELKFVYPSWDALLLRLPDDIQATNSPKDFEQNSEIESRVLSKHNSAEIFKANVLSYYEAHFSRKS